MSRSHLALSGFICALWLGFPLVSACLGPSCLSVWGSCRIPARYDLAVPVFRGCVMASARDMRWFHPVRYDPERRETLHTEIKILQASGCSIAIKVSSLKRERLLFHLSRPRSNAASTTRRRATHICTHRTQAARITQHAFRRFALTCCAATLTPAPLFATSELGC